MSRDTVKLAFFMIQDFAGDAMLKTVNILHGVQAAAIAAESKSKCHCKIPSLRFKQKRRKQKQKDAESRKRRKRAETASQSTQKITLKQPRKLPQKSAESRRESLIFWLDYPVTDAGYNDLPPGLGA